MPIEAKDIFEATSRSLRELLSENGLGLYIPPYQRPYGWDRGKVNKLLDDTLHGLAMLLRTDDSFTFLGTIITIHDIKYTTVQPIVREEVPAKVLTVIDGQQRLCTLLLLAVCLHNQIRLRYARVFKDKEPPPDDPVLMWIHGQTLNLLKDLGATIYERQAYGDSPIYPRLIRAFTDQWSRKSQLAQYASPAAHLVFAYAKSEQMDEKKLTEFRPQGRVDVGEGEADLVKRYNEIRSVLRDIARAKTIEDLEDFPALNEVAGKKSFQKALLNHEFPEEVIRMMERPTSHEFEELLRLLLLAAYVLNRIALTVVKGKNEDYAFTIFESLNTTGEPLTAFETFRPRVVSAEGLADYEKSESRQAMDRVADYLASFRVGDPLQNATRDLLVSFALAETGEKLSKRLADQRSYLAREFERHSGNAIDRINFIHHLRDTASFVEHTWSARETSPHLEGLPVDATTDSVRLCSAFLRELNHSVTIGPLVRFYAAALNAPAPSQGLRIRDLEDAIRAITAFSVFWRTSRRTTDNIDRVYREIMGGVSSLAGLPALARMRRAGANPDGVAPTVDVAGLKKELLARLTDPAQGDVADREKWIAMSAPLPIYQTSRPLARLVLLSAYHDTVEDPSHPGLIMKGKEASASCLSFEGWRDEKHLSLEHVAPQASNTDWPGDVYADKELIHRLGNLVLVPPEANSSLSDKPWPAKRTLYAALGAPSKEGAKAHLKAALESGITFATSTEALVELSKHMPHLAALGRRMGEWDRSFIEDRSRSLLTLAWDTLRPWLEPT